MENLIIKTPTKINLGLNILRKRDDGYHDIETFFYPINLFDTLTFSEAPEFKFICSNQELNNEKNLVVRAKEYLEDKLQIKINVKIELEKNIPVGAGLGGGSSDAAAALIGMNQLLNLKVDDSVLFNIASKLGADVPFFLNPHPSYAESKGDYITAVDCKLRFPILIVNPGINVSTKWAYENVIPATPTFPLKKLIDDCELDFLFMQNKIKNDFEPIVFKEYPEIEEIKKAFYKLGAMFALMSGSGSTVYGIFPNVDKAERAKDSFGNTYFTFLHHEPN
jgi:4-diphosphocytidyl-2-C-methyl-D-erythritol kinase